RARHLLDYGGVEMYGRPAVGRADLSRSPVPTRSRRSAGNLHAGSNPRNDAPIDGAHPALSGWMILMVASRAPGCRPNPAYWAPSPGTISIGPGPGRPTMVRAP